MPCTVIGDKASTVKAYCPGAVVPIAHDMNGTTSKRSMPEPEKTSLCLLL